MKRLIRLAVAASLAVGWLAAGAGWTWAQSGSSGTRVAVVNLYVVFKDSVRIKNFKEEMKKLTEPHDKKIKEYRKGYDGWTKAYKTETDNAKKEQARKYALNYKRALEDEVASVNKKLEEHSKRHVVALYREIEAAVARYAKANAIQLVFYYFDPIEPDQRYDAQNLHQKFAAASNVRAASPIYIADGLDISAPVTQMLNSMYTSAGAGAGN